MIGECAFDTTSKSKQVGCAGNQAQPAAMDAIAFWISVFAAICCIALLNFNVWQLIQARRRRSFYQKQGIGGPPFRFLVGNLPEIRELQSAAPLGVSSFDSPSKFRVNPDLCHFAKTYGKISIHELGSITRIVVADVELIREVLVSRSSCYGKADLIREALKSLLGNGIVLSNGDLWRQQRRILNPAFKMAYLKGLTKHMCNAGESLAKNWSLQIHKQGFHAIDAHREMAGLTLDVITKASFGASIGGANSGHKAFSCLDKLLTSALLSLNSYERLIPGYEWFPTPKNLRLWKDEKYVNELLTNIIEDRRSKTKSDECEHDLLDMMLEAMEKKSQTMTMNQLLDECKTIFFAGHSTTGLTLTWVLIMLSVHQKWQKIARDEVLAAIAKSENGFLSAEDLAALESVGWIINEVLRLFPPVSNVSRQCQQAHTIGGLSIIPGTIVTVPILMVLQSQELWGKDAYEFKPERFKNKSQKDLPAFLVFGAGPRMCLGMNFALMEAKLVLAILLRDFSFSLSKDYKHAPGNPLSLKPGFGAPLIVKKFQN